MTERFETVAAAMAHLNAPDGAADIIRDVLDHAVYDRERDDKCADAVEAAEAWLAENAA